ncbi:helix-turn-helix transcriptional regulator [Tatumella citrea]|uniref:Transcriptional regulator n=1 Tax=Tatumella citrea TaxID=53336 RepID=A0A1Y0LJT8_TATCI|nr:PAS domain-containing protein [Tatumella citrea]ARU94323.1 hypothetical protein A7K98_11400 [Tatumella citrea]ARU98363.1 hypothetical protein A7K99_11400 [Tatumella citrea]
MSERSAAEVTDHFLMMLAAAVRVIGSVVSRNAEVVLHDLRQPEYSIVEIVNSQVTGRKQGDPILAGMRTDPAFVLAMQNSHQAVSEMLDYTTYSRDGKPLRSSSAIYRDHTGTPFAALCINVEQAGIDNALQILSVLGNLAVPAIQPEPPAEVAPENMEEMMRDIIASASAQSPGNSRSAGKQANLLAVSAMQQKGLFMMKGGVEKAAAALGVTRYTIYNYLDALKSTDS